MPCHRFRVPFNCRIELTTLSSQQQPFNSRSFVNRGGRTLTTRSSLLLYAESRPPLSTRGHISSASSSGEMRYSYLIIYFSNLLKMWNLSPQLMSCFKWAASKRHFRHILMETTLFSIKKVNSLDSHCTIDITLIDPDKIQSSTCLSGVVVVVVAWYDGSSVSWE